MPQAGIRDRLLAYRIARGWTQAQTAKKAGVSPTTIAHLETGDNDNPRRITLMRLATAFDVSLEEFLGEAPQGQPGLFDTAPEAPQLELAAMWRASKADRRAALDNASAAEVAAYVAAIDKQLAWAEEALHGPKGALHDPEEDSGNVRGLRSYVRHLLLLRDEADPDPGPPPTPEDMRALVADAGAA